MVALSLRAGALCGGRPGSSVAPPAPAVDLRWMFPPGRNQGTLVRDHKFPRNLGADEALGGIRGEVPMAEKLHKKSKYFIPNPLANRPSVLSVAWSPLLPLVHL